eukprot:CAMPEP_0197826698 /NCGR_PEP_ID=MMETSP1437-20131217/3610_1 /TAXON_ID=49252 ORGANISM="Eucampia antarctica, Strain CCMP1452" /NCGR_SAMPLE_ID=MMETSP1437 /ASSEMBLY_ACC=CAM_ASM_001096 /LENGTH=354 /DNA_ID=CAMNT_0043427235 /DNA_START=98 /DNA_END=1162 /DNA_ORIENTATION=+
MRSNIAVLMAVLVCCSFVSSSGNRNHHHHGVHSAFLPRSSSHVLYNALRGGSRTSVMEQDDTDTDTDTDNSGMTEEEVAARQIRLVALEKYHMEQQILLTLRSTFLSEVLAQRGIPIATMMDVSTIDGNKPPEPTDWDCALSTEQDPKTCLYSFDAEPNSKVVAPLGTTQYISLSALNRLRRTDRSKVEPMWHSKYAILSSWFSDASEYSLLQHAGIQGFFVSTLLLDTMGLRLLLAVGVMVALLITLPVWEILVQRILTSSYFWNQWTTWGRIAHAALPMKLLLGQMAWKFLAQSFASLETYVRDIVVDYECTLLEQTIPITIFNNDQLQEQEEDDDDEEIQYSEDEECDEYE